jgi:type II restriction enzyme
MNLQMPAVLASGYKSRCQQARVVSEGWGSKELFCVSCDSPELSQLANNYKSADLICPRCDAPFQLKATSGSIGHRICDGAYGAMVHAIREDRTPNLLLLHYDSVTWCVRDLLLIPHFAFPESAIIKRKPLSDTARRAGWVGCNISLDRIAPDARIPIVVQGQPRPEGEVRADFRRLKPLSKIGASERGWTLDVLNAVRKLGRTEFTTHDAYSFDTDLQSLHPGNRHVRPKIRQQLQVLRDAGILLHLSRNHWRLR